MNAYHPEPPAESDHDRIRKNGMWYESWQSGYLDIIKRGHPKPKNQKTILAELHSPNVQDFLHGASETVPFLVSDRAKRCLMKASLAGFSFEKVELAKIASKGMRSRRARSGEPEDAIMKAKNVIGAVAVPKLAAVYVSGLVEVTPEFPSGRTPSRHVSPFTLPRKSRKAPDLWTPTIDSRPFTAWVFCSEKFMTTVTEAGLSNIQFRPLEEFMDEYRRNCPCVSRGEFIVLLSEEAEGMGVRVDWGADVAVTSEMKADKNFTALNDIAQRGRLTEPIKNGRQTIPAGSAVFMDGFGLHFIWSQ